MDQPKTPEVTSTAVPKRPRRKFDATFKQAALEHCRRQGGNVSQAAQDLGLNYWTLRDWVTAAQPPHAAAARSPVELEQENSRLHRLIAELLLKNQQLRKPIQS